MGSTNIVRVGVRCGIRLSRSRHLMPALRPRLAARLVEADPASRRQAGDWDSNPGSRLPRQRCSRIAGFNHPAIPSNTVGFPPPADHAVPNPRSGLPSCPSEAPPSTASHVRGAACAITSSLRDDDPPTRCRPFSRIAMGARPTATPGLFERAHKLRLARTKAVISACPAQSTRFASILGVRRRWSGMIL